MAKNVAIMIHVMSAAPNTLEVPGVAGPGGPFTRGLHGFMGAGGMAVYGLCRRLSPAALPFNCRDWGLISAAAKRGRPACPSDSLLLPPCSA